MKRLLAKTFTFAALTACLAMPLAFSGCGGGGSTSTEPDAAEAEVESDEYMAGEQGQE